MSSSAAAAEVAAETAAAIAAVIAAAAAAVEPSRSKSISPRAAPHVRPAEFTDSFYSHRYAMLPPVVLRPVLYSAALAAAWGLLSGLHCGVVQCSVV